MTITALNGDGTSDATTLNNVNVIVTGEGVPVGQKAYVLNGAITRQAPDLIITQVAI